MHVDVLVVRGGKAPVDMDGMVALMERYNRRVARVAYVSITLGDDLPDTFMHQLKQVSVPKMVFLHAV